MTTTKKATAPKNLTALTTELAETFADIKNREISVDESKAISNVAAKMISTVKAQIEYHKLCNTKNPKIAFVK